MNGGKLNEVDHFCCLGNFLECEARVERRFALMGLDEHQAEDKSRMKESYKVSNHSGRVEMDAK